MLQSWEPMYEVCQILAQQEQLQTTVSSAFAGALVTAGGAFLGALLGGPRGLAIGAGLAATTTALVTEGSYRSVVDILRNDLTREQKQKLARAVSQLVNATSGDVMTIVATISADSFLRSSVIQEIGNFLSTELNLDMISNN